MKRPLRLLGCGRLWLGLRCGMSEIRPPQPLSTEHDTSAFNCGKAPLNEFLQRHALDKQRAMLSRTYVALSGEAIAGYYTLAHSWVVQSEAPKKLARGMPPSIPVMLMARFAVDLRFRGRGLGRSLFTDAVGRTWAVMQLGAAPMRFFVVDAKDEEAKAFYQRFDMIAASQNPMGLYLSYKTLCLAVGSRTED